MAKPTLAFECLSENAKLHFFHHQLATRLGKLSPAASRLSVCSLLAEPQPICHPLHRNSLFFILNFEAGELDALMTARAPSSFNLGKPNIDRLWPNFREVEKEYYRKTKMFPIMHLMGLRKDLHEAHPWLASSIYKALIESRDIAYEDLAKTASLSIALPWVDAERRDTIELMGNDFWRYGVEECRHEIEALARYSHSHGLSERLLTPEDLFAPSTLEISKI